MKPYARTLKKGHVRKFTIVDHTPARIGDRVSKEYPDKTATMSSRPASKRTIRNANRAQTKSARKRLKLELTRDSAG